MKFKISKKWCKKAAELEGDSDPTTFSPYFDKKMSNCKNITQSKLFNKIRKPVIHLSKKDR